jgi:hypothetical protein
LFSFRKVHPSTPKSNSLSLFYIQEQKRPLIETNSKGAEWREQRKDRNKNSNTRTKNSFLFVVGFLFNCFWIGLVKWVFSDFEKKKKKKPKKKKKQRC